MVRVVQCGDRPHLTLRFTDPLTGRRHSRSAGTRVRREAERLAARWEAELREGRYKAPTKASWAEFRERFEAEKGASLSENTRSATCSAFNHLERLINPSKLCALTASIMSQFQARMRQEGMKDTTIATHLRHLRAALGWGVTVQLLPAVPELHMPRRARGQTLMRGRPLTQLEFQKMLKSASIIRPHDTAVWTHHLTGLWLSGLRLDESIVLSWSGEGPFVVDLTGRHPRFRIYAEAEKGRRDRLLPMTPDFAEYLLQTPHADRTGHVFKLIGRHTARQMTSARAGRVISDIGEWAEVVVNSTEGKHASAHDLRRSFGTRWAPRVKPATLQLLMRHRSIETTMKYYVDQDADDVADELWATHAPAQSGVAS